MPADPPPRKGLVPPTASDEENEEQEDHAMAGLVRAGDSRHRGKEGAERSNDVLKSGQKVGAVGIAEHFGTYGRGRYAGATGEGEKVGVKGVALDFEQLGSGAAANPLADSRPGNGIGVHGISGSGAGVRGDSRTGVGVAGKSRSVAGIEGQSEFDVGGVFVSGNQAQLRLYPTLRNLPESGRAGDLIAMLGRHATLDVPTAELWFCVQSGSDAHKAIWKRVAFNDTSPDTEQ